MRLIKIIMAMGCAALLGACSSTVSSDNDDFSPQTFSELGKCNNSNKGEMVYLPKDNERYLCENGEWKQLVTAEKISSSSTTDFKEETSSSSNIKDDSFSSNSTYQEKDCESGYLCDARDGSKYKVIIIGNQVWMAENLNYKTENSYCYDLADVYCKKYGSLYEWITAMAITNENDSITNPHQGICPSGWHIPSYDEFFDLADYVDKNNGEEGVGKSLKSKEWDKSSIDKFGFAALGAGLHWNIGFDYKDSDAYFWSTKRDGSNGNNNYWTIQRDSFSADWEFTGNAYSVRCIKD